MNLNRPLLGSLFQPALKVGFVVGLVVALAITFIRPAAAESQRGDDEPAGTVVVYGKARSSHLKAVAKAVEAALRGAGWDVGRRFSAREADTVVRCFAADKPGLCIAATAASYEVSRVVAVQVDPERGEGRKAPLRLSGQLATAGTADVVLQMRFCNPCGKDELTSVSQDLVKLLLDSSEMRAANTKLELRIKPSSAVVTLDGKLIGGDSKELPTVAGTHTLLFELDGYVRQSRTVEVEEGQTQIVEVELLPLAGITIAPPADDRQSGVVRPPPGDPSDPGAPTIPGAPGPGTGQPERGGRGWRPYTLLAVGGLAIVGGVVGVLIDEDPKLDPTLKQPPTIMDTGRLGASMIVGGAVLAGFGGVLWWKAGDKPKKKRTVTAIVPTRSGALVGVGGTF